MTQPFIIQPFFYCCGARVVYFGSHCRQFINCGSTKDRLELAIEKDQKDYHPCMYIGILKEEQMDTFGKDLLELGWQHFDPGTRSMYNPFGGLHIFVLNFRPRQVKGVKEALRAFIT